MPRRTLIVIAFSLLALPSAGCHHAFGSKAVHADGWQIQGADEIHIIRRRAQYPAWAGSELTRPCIESSLLLKFFCFGAGPLAGWTVFPVPPESYRAAVISIGVFNFDIHALSKPVSVQPNKTQDREISQSTQSKSYENLPKKIYPNLIGAH